MDYPGNFDTPAFPAGKRIATSRLMGTVALVLFFLIACATAGLLWAANSMRTTPFLITIDRVSGTWRVVDTNAHRADEYNMLDAVQESVVSNFAASWFSISSDTAENNDIWRKCEPDSCTGAETLGYTGRACAIACGGADKVFGKFSDSVMPNYVMRSAGGEVWTPQTDTLKVTKMSTASKTQGGTWRVHGYVHSNINGDFGVIAFVRVERDTTKYPMSLGYYVSDFNAYRLKQ